MICALHARLLSDLSDLEHEGKKRTLIRRASKILDTKSMSRMIPTSTAVTIGKARGIVDRVCADEESVDSGVQVSLATIDESAVIPTIFNILIYTP